MLREKQVCLFCERIAKLEEQFIDNKHYILITCENCGKYLFQYESFFNIGISINNRFLNKKHILSGIIRERFERKLSGESITVENFPSIISSVNIPESYKEKLDKLLLYFYRKTEYLRHSFKYENIPAIGYAKNEIELGYMIQTLGDKNLIVTGDDYIVYLTQEGMEKAEELRTSKVIANQAFVAMWFDDEVKGIFENYIKPAIEGKTLEGKEIDNEKHFKAIKIDLKEFNDDILDNIISEIRKSRFIVADFTGNRGGVYYESGFAYGLDINVIHTCRKDWFDKLHFDVNHKNYIVWETGEELYEKLLKRISATII